MKNFILFILSILFTIPVLSQLPDSNKVLSFNGVSSSVDLPANAANGVRTVELFFKPYVDYDSTITETASLVVRNETSQTGEFGLFIGAFNNREGRITFERRIGQQQYYIISDDNKWKANKWYHVAGVIDSVHGMRLYIDGVLQKDTDPSTASSDAQSELISLGKWGNKSFAPFRHFYGEIDEVKIWSRALSSNEINSNKCNILNVTQSSGLKAYYRFEGDSANKIEDQSLNGHDGTNNNAVHLIRNPCSPQKFVLDFDGNDDHVIFPKDIANNVRTIEMWFKPARKYDQFMSETASLIVRNQSSEYGEFGIYIGAFTNREGRVTFFRKIGQQQYYVVSDSNSWEANRWYHVAGVIDPVHGMRLYIDGVLQNDTDPSTAPSDVRTEIMALGRWGNNAKSAGRYFNGEIDEVRVWENSRSQQEISQWMCDTLDPANHSGLQAYYRFDEANHYFAEDFSSNDFKGSITGAVHNIDTICEATVSGLEGHNRFSEKQVNVYPNPFYDEVTIGHSYKGDLRLVIYNVYGELVSQQFYAAGEKMSMKRNSIGSGVYFFQIRNDEEKVLSTGRIVAQ